MVLMTGFAKYNTVNMQMYTFCEMSPERNPEI